MPLRVVYGEVKGAWDVTLLEGHICVLLCFFNQWKEGQVVGVVTWIQSALPSHEDR
jgi:hypothetical protein